MKKAALMKELKDLRNEIARLDALAFSRKACPREVIEATERRAGLRVKADELERRIANHAG